MRFGIHKVALLVGAAAVLTPVAAAAQVRDLDQAQSDVRVFQGSVDSAASVYEVSVPAGSVMQIDVLSTSDLDPIVSVTDAATGEVIAEDDDGGENLNSRVRIMGNEGRRIVIEVNSFDASWAAEGEEYGGSFDLRLETSAYTPPVILPVTYGARQEGEVRGEPTLFTMEGVAGERVEIALTSPDGELDPFLELRDDTGEVIAFNDDGGNGLNSLLNYVFEEDGTYTIAATGYGTSEGAFLLRIRDRRDAAPQLPLQVIGIADQASGELGSPWADDGLLPPYIDYQLSEEAIATIVSGDGDVTIRMNAVETDDADFAGQIDPYVELGFDTPLGFAVATYDDDGSGTLDSMLPVDLGLLADNPAMLGMLRIRVQGFGGSSGPYTLEITEGMEARAETYDAWEGGMAPPPIMIPPPAPVGE